MAQEVEVQAQSDGKEAAGDELPDLVPVSELSKVCSGRNNYFSNLLSHDVCSC